MGVFQVCDGDFRKDSVGGIKNGELSVIDKDGKSCIFDKVKEVKEIAIQNKTQWGRKAAWGVGVGLVTFGLGGLVAGVLAGRGKIITCEVSFFDDRSFIGVTDKNGFEELLRMVKNPETEKLNDNPFMEKLLEYKRVNQERKDKAMKETKE